MDVETWRDADNRVRITLDCSLAEFDALATLVMETEYTRASVGIAVAEQLNGEFAAAEDTLFDPDSEA
jgi:hypothetical protein